MLFFALPVSLAWGQTDTSTPTSSPTGIQIYTSADETSLPVGTLLPGDNATPIAETQGAGDVKWYLIKTKSGIVGWIRQSDNDHAKKVDHFFKSLPPENSGTAINIPTVSSAAAPRGAIIVPVLSAGNSSIVSVVLNQSIRGNLMLDTGATHTVISRRLAGLLSLRTLGKSPVSTVGGVIAVSVARLRSLKVGEAEVTDLQIIVHDFSRDPRVEGLLGMDFLGRYRFGLDVQRQLLVLSPR